MIAGAEQSQAHQKLMQDSRAIREAAQSTLRRSHAAVASLAAEIKASRDRRARDAKRRARLTAGWFARPNGGRGAARDPRWILLTLEGEHVVLADGRELDDEDIAAAELALSGMGQCGWLAVMSHPIDAEAALEVIMVRPLCNPPAAFREAVALLERRRC